MVHFCEVVEPVHKMISDKKLGKVYCIIQELSLPSPVCRDFGSPKDYGLIKTEVLIFENLAEQGFQKSSFGFY